MRRDSLDKMIRHRAERSRGSGEIPKEQQKPSISTTPISAPTPVPQPKSHATANHNSNATSSSSQKDITPRWVKPSKIKLEEVLAAAAQAPSSTEDGAVLHRRPHSKGFIPGSDRGSNASQYDNVPGLLEQQFEISELERPPSRRRTPLSIPSIHQGDSAHAPSPPDNIITRPRMGKYPPPFSHNSPTEGPVRYHSPPQQHSPGRTTTEVPIFHPAYTVSLDYKGKERLYGPPSQFVLPSNMPYGEQVYATTHRQTNSISPEKVLMNNTTYNTYHRQPPHSTARVQAIVDNRLEGHWKGELNPLHYLPEGGAWQPIQDETPLQSPGGMPRSPSFQQAQMSPVLQFTFPDNPDSLHHYRTQKQLPQLFGGPHYRHAQEAFAMQESMLL